MEGHRIEIAILRRACEEIFRFIERDLKLSSVEVENSLYWTLPHDVQFDMTKPPPLADHVGDLLDDYAFVESMNRDPDQALPLMLEHVAPLLAFIAQRVPNFR